MGRKKQRQTIGHEYSLGMHMVVGHSNMDGVEKVRVGEKVAWIPAVAQQNNIINDSHNTGDDDAIASTEGAYMGQTFTVSATGYYTVSVKLKLYRSAGYAGNTTISINEVGADGTPTDAIISAHGGNVAKSNAVVASSITANIAGEWVEFILDAQTYLATDLKYTIVLRPEGAGSVLWRLETTGTYSGGRPFLHSGSWLSTLFTHDQMFEIYLAEGNAPNHTIAISNLDLFGGSRREGGIRGSVDILFGASDQGQNPYLVSRYADDNTPAFRGSTGFVLNQVYIGTSPYLKPWSFYCRRLRTQVSGDVQWNITKAVINPGGESGDDLNPAHIIRECLIDGEWGLGFETSDIDSTSFELAAEILYDEVFGISLLWDQIEQIEDFIGSVLTTIAGFLYQDLSTGKWVLSLTRDPVSLNLNFVNEDSYNSGDDNSSGLTLDTDSWVAQTFTATSKYNLGSIRLLLLRLAAESPGTITVSIREVVGSPQTARPTGIDLVSTTVDGSTLTSDAAGEWVDFFFADPLAIILGQQYAIVLRCAAAAGTLALRWRNDQSATEYVNGNTAGSSNSGASWSPFATRDAMFEVYESTTESFNENHIMEVEEFARPSYGEIIDQVVVNWWDKLADKSRIVMAQDIALIEKQSNSIIELNLNHYGVCNAALANKIAERELKIVSSMLAAMRLKCTRQMSHLRPNDVFKLSWSALGITQMVVRVIDVDYGSLLKNEIYMTCLEDAFSTAETVFADPPDSEWTDPVNEAIDISDIDIIEIPYWVLINEIENQSVVDAYSTAAGFVMLATAPPTSDSLDFEYLAQQSAGLAFVSEGTAAFTPNATLTNSMFKEAQSITIDLATTYSLTLVEDSLVDGETYAIINTEIVKVTAIDTDNNQITIERGVLDTVPEAHASGDFVYFIGTDYENIGTEYTDGDQPAFKILPRTGTGQLLEASASTQTADLLDSRMIRPYPPGNLKFNAESYPTYLSTAITGGFEITWAHRDRTDATQVGTIVLHTDATDYGPEAGTTYTIKIYDEDDVLARTVTGIAGVAYEYTEAFEIADSGTLQKQLRFEIYSVRDGFDSWLLGYDVLIKRTLAGAVNAVSGVTGYLTGGKTLIRGTVAASSAVTGTLT